MFKQKYTTLYQFRDFYSSYTSERRGRGVRIKSDSLHKRMPQIAGVQRERGSPSIRSRRTYPFSTLFIIDKYTYKAGRSSRSTSGTHWNEKQERGGRKRRFVVTNVPTSPLSRRLHSLRESLDSVDCVDSTRVLNGQTARISTVQTVGVRFVERWSPGRLRPRLIFIALSPVGDADS